MDSDKPYHSKYMISSAQPMADMIRKYVPNPQKRSNKWLSTALSDDEINHEFDFASADYFAKNLISPVHFYDKLKQLPSDAIIIEISPHSVFKNVISDTLEESTYINLMSKYSNDTNLLRFLSGITKLYELGFNPSIEKLYSKVNWPVSRGTASISSLMVWDHNRSFPIKKYPQHYNKHTASDLIVKININKDYSYLTGHCVNKDIIFPAAGFLVLAWRQLAEHSCKFWTEMPVVFENVKFKRLVFLNSKNDTILKVRYSQITSKSFLIKKNILCTLIFKIIF